MAYRDCPCLNCKDRSHGSKRVACQTGCEKYLSWKAKEPGIKKKRERITALLLKCKKNDHKKPSDEKKER